VRRAFIVDLAVEDRAAADLSVGGVFVPNATVNFDDECQIVLRAGTEDVTVAARAVQISEAGAGFQIEDMTPALRERIASLLTLAKHVNVDLERKKTLTRTRAHAPTEELRRAANGSIAPSNRRNADRRMAEGSISPIVAFAPTQSDEAFAEKIRAAHLAADAKKSDDTDD
jgi:hypothetical protein